MENLRLLQTLQQLHDELSRAERVDPHTLAELEALTDDIRQALDKRDPQAAAGAEPISGLRHLLLKYEAEHPHLSAAIGRVADALAAMGF
jgi:hypothetical protein